MLASYLLTLWLAGGPDPGRFSTVCVCTLPAGVRSSRAAVIRHARRDAFTVFVGAVTAIEVAIRDSVPWPDSGSVERRYFIYPTAMRYTLEVERVWKGAGASKVTITDYAAGTECAQPYALGQTYLIYAQKDLRTEAVTALTTTICSRILFKEEEIAAEWRLLGSGRTPGG